MGGGGWGGRGESRGGGGRGVLNATYTSARISAVI